MTRLRCIVVAIALDEDDSPPSHEHATHDIDTDLEEVSRVVESIRPGLAKALPRGAYELGAKRRASR